jgi:hypothetical protein
MWYAERFNETGNPIYFVGGVFAALWTPETYIQTAITLAAAPLVAAEITAAGAQSAVAAARVAAKKVVEEVVGVPVPIGPKGLSAPKWDNIAISPKKLSIKWDQKSQRWKDTSTGQYVKGPEMPIGFGKPSTWKEGTKDVSSELISTKEGQKVYEQMMNSSTQDDFVGAFEQVLKSRLEKKY